MTENPIHRPAQGYEDEGLGPKDHSDGVIEEESELTRDGLGPSPHGDKDESSSDADKDDADGN